MEHENSQVVEYSSECTQIPAVLPRSQLHPKPESDILRRKFDEKDKKRKREDKMDTWLRGLWEYVTTSEDDCENNDAWCRLHECYLEDVSDRDEESNDKLDDELRDLRTEWSRQLDDLRKTGVCPAEKMEKIARRIRQIANKFE